MSLPTDPKKIARVDRLLSSGQISEDDHRILVSALGSAKDRQRHDSRHSFALDLILNPFAKLSAFTALALGLIGCVLLSWLGEKLQIHFRGALDLQILQQGSTPITLTTALIQNLVDALGLSLCFYLLAFAFRKPNLRFIDFLSSVAASRLSYFCFAALLAALVPFFPGLLPRTTEAGKLTEGICLAILGLLFLVWHLLLLFSAVRDSSGLKGRALWFTYVAGILIAELITNLSLGHFLS